jgi:hypothetical protein
MSTGESGKISKKVWCYVICYESQSSGQNMYNEPERKSILLIVFFAVYEKRIRNYLMARQSI